MQGMNELDLDDFKEIFNSDVKRSFIFRSSGLRMYMLNKYQATHKAMPITADIVDLKTSIPRQDSTISTITKQKSVTFNDEITLYHIQSQQQDELPTEQHFKLNLRVPLSEEGCIDSYEGYQVDLENEETSDILMYRDIIVLSHTSNNLALYHDFSDKDEIDTVSLNSIRDDTARWILKPKEKQEKTELEAEVRYGMEVRLKNICTKMYLRIEKVGDQENEQLIISCNKESSGNTDWIIEPAYDYGTEQWHPSHDILFRHVNTGLFLSVDMQTEETESQSVVIPSHSEGNGLWYIENKTVD
jgi:dolichyl-phosphate-mannose--protein O-mannosyl transferase